jgi:hypothetical protein
MNARQFARAQSKPLGRIRKLIRAVLHLIGVPITPLQVDDVAMRLYRPILAARDENYLAGLKYLHDVAPEILAPAPRLYTPQVLTATIESVVEKVRIEGEPVNATSRLDTRVIEQVRPVIEGPILRQVLDPVRETIADIGQDEEEYVHYGWARVLVGAYSCAFCAMLASRGAVYTSKAAAKGKGGSPLNLYHTPYTNKNGKRVGGFCDCSVVLVHQGRSWEGEKAWLALEDLWEKTVTDQNVHYTDAPNAFRREWEKRVRAGQTKIYLPESLAA